MIPTVLAAPPSSGGATNVALWPLLLTVAIIAALAGLVLWAQLTDPARRRAPRPPKSGDSQSAPVAATDTAPTREPGTGPAGHHEPGGGPGTASSSAPPEDPGAEPTRTE